MAKDKYIIEKQFPPLDDLYVLLKLLENTLETKINEDDYIIGRKQLYYIFLHETIHAFVTNKAGWIHELKADETDFVDELAARIIIDDVIKRLSIYNKMDAYYERYVHHNKELELYGFKITEEIYNKIEQKWYKDCSEKNDIDTFCKYILEYYRNNIKEVGREKDFEY
ncbi:MAG: hypothetical protein LBK73_10830 [Treponema sp.]|jgi:hypothetical protein|nr:hypothetical protein [Treponema sp.]